jgi:hypothetical protein
MGSRKPAFGMEAERLVKICRVPGESPKAGLDVGLCKRRVSNDVDMSTY